MTAQHVKPMLGTRRVYGRLCTHPRAAARCDLTGGGDKVTMRGFGELESKVMDALWSSGKPSTVRDVLEELRRNREIAYTTVLTVMDILYRKGWLERERESRAYRYWPTSSREQYVAELMRDALTVSNDHIAALMHFTEQLSEEESLALRAALRRRARRTP